MTPRPARCPGKAACPAVVRRLDGTYLVVGEHAPLEAARYDLPMAADETAVLLPQSVMDAHEKPLRDRIAELEAELAEVRADRDMFRATVQEQAARLLTVDFGIPNRNGVQR